MLTPGRTHERMENRIPIWRHAEGRRKKKRLRRKVAITSRLSLAITTYYMAFSLGLNIFNADICISNTDISNNKYRCLNLM